MTDYVDALVPSGMMEKLRSILSNTDKLPLMSVVTELFLVVKFVLNFIINAVLFIPRILNGIATFFLSLYLMLPGAINTIVGWFNSFRGALNHVFSQNVVESAVDGAKEGISSISSSDAGSSLFEWVKFILNSDVFIASIQALASLLFIWVQICVVICIIVTALITSSLVVYGTRKATKLLSGGFIDV